MSQGKSWDPISRFMNDWMTLSKQGCKLLVHLLGLTQLQIEDWDEFHMQANCDCYYCVPAS